MLQLSEVYSRKHVVNGFVPVILCSYIMFESSRSKHVYIEYYAMT